MATKQSDIVQQLDQKSTINKNRLFESVRKKLMQETLSTRQAQNIWTKICELLYISDNTVFNEDSVELLNRLTKSFSRDLLNMFVWIKAGLYEINKSYTDQTSDTTAKANDIIKMYINNVYSSLASKNWHLDTLKRWNTVFIKDVINSKGSALRHEIKELIVQYFFDVEEQFYISSPAVAFHILCPILELFHHNTTKGFHGMILDKCCDYIQSLFQNCIFIDKDRQKFSILQRNYTEKFSENNEGKKVLIKFEDYVAQNAFSWQMEQEDPLAGPKIPLRSISNSNVKKGRTTKNSSKSITKSKVNNSKNKKNNSKKAQNKVEKESPSKSKIEEKKNSLKLGENITSFNDQEVGKKSQDTKTLDETVTNSKTSPQKAKKTPEKHELENKIQGMY